MEIGSRAVGTWRVLVFGHLLHLVRNRLVDSLECLLGCEHFVLLEESEKDRRTNSYMVTRRGEREIEARCNWGEGYIE